MVLSEGEDVMFGDGYFAKLFDIVPDSTDKEHMICKMRPTKYTAEAFKLDISDTERDRLTGNYTRKYRRDFIIERNRGPRGRSYLFLCNWNGDETDLLEYIGNKQLLKINYLMGMVKNLRLQRAYQLKEINNGLSQPELYREEHFKKLTKIYTQIGQPEVSGENPKQQEQY
mgnify:CR=1 FL=1